MVPMKSLQPLYEFVTKFVACFTVFTFVVGICLALFFPEATTAIEMAEQTMTTSLLALIGLLGGKILKR
jgi:hypothetical protein